MKSRRAVTIIAVLCAFIGGIVSAAAQPQGGGVGCAIAITSPKFGEPVAGSGDVIGTAKIPSNEFLWVFAHRQGLAGWFPQGDGSSPVSQGNWSVVVTYGVERDVGHDFDVVVAAVNSSVNADLQNWFAKADSTGVYPPIPFPASDTACPVAKVTVRKTG